MIRFFISALLMLAVANVHAQDGSWNGNLAIQGIKLPLVFNFANDGCTLDSPSQGAKGIKAEKTVLANNGIRVSVPAIGAVFEGTNCGDSICGTFSQNGMSFPLTLKPGAIKAKRPQTPTAPLPYDEEEVSFTNGHFTFNGTLTLPKRCNRTTPAVLMVTGSGQQNRDEEIFEHKPFAVIADALARQGIASLRYDDRGYGDKTVNFTDFTTNDFKQDAEAGAKMLRKRFDKVGILGHSEGGTIALMLGAEHKADFVVSLAGMAISGKETLLQQNRQGLLAVGMPTEMVNKYCQIIDNIFTAIAAGKEPQDIATDSIPTAFKPLAEKAKEQLASPYMRHFLQLDASKLLPSIKCPVLALNGKKDTQVDCSTNVSALENGLTNCPHTIRAIDGLNHLFQHCTTGNIVEYQQIEETISPEVLETIVAWIRAMH